MINRRLFNRPSGGRRVVMSLLAGVILVSCGLVGGCAKSSNAAGAAAMKMPPPMVTVAEAASKDVPVYLDEIGTIVATQSVQIQPQVTGPITKIGFVDGQTVKKGDLLFVIDPSPYQAALDHAVATLDQNQKKLDFAETDFKMAQDLQNLPGAMSREDYEQKKNTRDIAVAQIKISQADVDTAKVNLAYCTITSPIDGRCGQRQYDLGTVVVGNNGFASAPMVTIVTVDPVYVDFYVPENRLPDVKEAMKAGQLDVTATLPDHPEHVSQGKLTFLDNAVQAGNGDVKLRATMPNADQYLWPGQFVKVRLILRTIKNAVLIPAQAQQISQAGPFVYVVKDDNTVEMRPITAGQRQGDMVVIDKGVEAGESVVVTGQLMLYPTSPVTVVPGAPAGGAPGGGPSAGNADSNPSATKPTDGGATSAG
jgi:multidrug efflux system membrane fusion protein